MSVLGELQPNKVFQYFEEICAIPHGSRNLQQISDYLVDFAKVHGLKYRQDEDLNVIIWKDGSKGYEDSDPVILQGHMDMVAVKESDCDKDMEKEGLDLEIDGDYILAKGTSLGGDDGIAVAYTLAVLDDEEMAHPPIEAIFTVNEEIGMLGAATIDVSDLKGRLFMNMDLYSYADTVAKAKSEANHVIRLIKGKKLSYPIYYDMEEKTVLNSTNMTRTKAAQIAQAFFSTLEAAGYKNLGIYSNASRFDSKLADGKLTASIFNQYPKWVASYNDTCKYQGNYHMWQYSNVGTIDGISENVDLNFKIGNWKKAGFTPKKVTLDKTSLTMTTGTSKTIKAYDPANSAYKLSVQWKSSNTKIATVDKNGKITAKSAGKVNITAVLNSQAKATCQVSIAPKPTKIKSVKKSGKNGIKVTWNKVSGISNYQIYMSTKARSGFKKIATISAQKTSYTKTKLKKGKKYYFKIRTAKKVSGTYYYSSYTAVKSIKR